MKPANVLQDLGGLHQIQKAIAPVTQTTSAPSYVERITEFTDNEGASPRVVCFGSIPQRVRCPNQPMQSIV